ncbi:MAG: 50S ribosomal protein L11 methyltransferase [Kiritimatiellae bacterium]|nr:50S ribosomal protein L11 methyltransferase [Kiritimatiellia bacterium]
MSSIDSDLYAEAPVLRARMEVPEGSLDALLDALWGLDPPVGSWQDLETGRAFLDCYAVDRAALERTAAAMRAAAAAEGLGGREVAFETLPREDWAESWKRFFHVIRVSPRVTVRPPWEPCEPDRPDGVVVTIEPGMSFGTGLHGTTQACLRFLEELAEEDPAAPPRSLADLGCGSGILSIAARKLGYAPVTGVDYDVAAVRVSAENARENGVADVAFAACDVTEDPIPRADAVVANILAPVLVRAAPRIAAAVVRGPRAALVLSGILGTQYADVRAAYEAQGFREVRSLALGEWTSGLFRPVG